MAKRRSKISLEQKFLYCVCGLAPRLFIVSFAILWVIFPEIAFAESGNFSDIKDFDNLAYNSNNFWYTKIKHDLANRFGLDIKDPHFVEWYDNHYWPLYEAYLVNVELPRVNAEAASHTFDDFFSLPEAERERRLYEAADSMLQTSKNLKKHGDLLRQLPDYFDQCRQFLPPICNRAAFCHGDLYGTGFDPCNWDHYKAWIEAVHLEIRYFRAGNPVKCSVIECPWLTFSKLQEYKAMGLENVTADIRIAQLNMAPTPDFLKPGFLDPENFFNSVNSGEVPGGFKNGDLPKHKEAFFGAGLPDIFLLIHIICVLFINLFFKKYFVSYKIVDINIGFSIVGIIFVVYLLWFSLPFNLFYFNFSFIINNGL